MQENILNIEKILKRLKDKLNLNNDNELSIALILKSRSLINHWKNNNVIDYDRIINTCFINNLDLNYIFFGNDYIIFNTVNDNNNISYSVNNRSNEIEILKSQIELLKDIIISLKIN